MPDSPDYQKYLPNSTRFPLSDMSELAARLGSLSVYDRRGELVFYDDFINLLTDWTITLSGTGAAGSVAATSYNSSHYYAKLLAGTTAAKKIEVSRIIGTYDLVKTGFEMVYAFPVDFDNVIFYFISSEETQQYSAYLKFDRINSKITIYDDITGWTDVYSPFVFFQSPTMYVPFKLTVDFDTGKYCELRVGRVTIDLSNHYLYHVMGINDPYLQTRVVLVGKAAANSELRLVYYLVTSNEP